MKHILLSMAKLDKDAQITSDRIAQALDLSVNIPEPFIKAKNIQSVRLLTRKINSLTRQVLSLTYRVENPRFDLDAGLDNFKTNTTQLITSKQIDADYLSTYYNFAFFAFAYEPTFVYEVAKFLIDTAQSLGSKPAKLWTLLVASNGILTLDIIEVFGPKEPSYSVE